MIRNLILAACLVTACGCSATRKAVTNKPAETSPDSPKQYEYRDMGQGGSTFRRH